jgi:hypothetical protein
LFPHGVGVGVGCGGLLPREGATVVGCGGLLLESAGGVDGGATIKPSIRGSFSIKARLRTASTIVTEEEEEKEVAIVENRW